MIVVTHLLRQSITLYKNLGGLEQNLGGLEPLSPIASAATGGEERKWVDFAALYFTRIPACRRPSVAGAYDTK